MSCPQKNVSTLPDVIWEAERAELPRSRTTALKLVLCQGKGTSRTSNSGLLHVGFRTMGLVTGNWSQGTR